MKSYCLFFRSVIWICLIYSASSKAGCAADFEAFTRAKFRAAIKDPQHLESYNKEELEAFLDYSFPGLVGKLNTENQIYPDRMREELQVPCAIALHHYVKKYLLEAENAGHYVIKSYDDLLRFNLL